MELSDLGPRICILGPSGSGKSTLADAIGRRQRLPVVHLDQLYHQPNTQWVPRPVGQFAALHDAAILGERWVIDGNYAQVMPQRLARATGLVALDVPTWVSLWRYVRRSLRGARVGGLAGASDRVNWLMVRHIAGPARRNRRTYARLYDKVALPKLRLGSTTAIDAQMAAWELPRPG